MIRLTKRSPLTGKENTMTIDCEIKDYYRWQNGMTIQKAMPYVSYDEREWLMTGIFPGEWMTFIKGGCGVSNR
jgi:hypothetical protein